MIHKLIFSVIISMLIVEGVSAATTKFIKVKSGEEFSILLSANPTTGYSWEIGEPLDEQMLVLIGSRYLKPKDPAFGAPGKEEWTFRALKQGKTEIVFHYRRPGERDIAPVEIRRFLVNIRK